MSDELLRSVRRMAEEGKLPDEITPELTFAAIADTNRVVHEIGETVKEIKENDLPHIEKKVDGVVRRVDENPSLLWLLRYRTSTTVKRLLVAGGVLVVIAIVAVTVPWVQDLIARVTGVPLP